MNTPAPVDIRQLQGLLGKSKAVMNKVETGDFEEGHLSENAISNAGNDLLDANQVQQMGGTPTQVAETSRPYKNLESSNMPDDIKKLMMEKPITQPTMGTSSTFSLDDVPDLVEKPMGKPQLNKRRTVNETVMVNNDQFTVSETVLRGIIKDVLLEYLTDDYNKKLTENAIAKTINTLIKEGKITTKRKKTA